MNMNVNMNNNNMNVGCQCKRRFGKSPGYEVKGDTNGEELINK